MARPLGHLLFRIVKVYDLKVIKGHGVAEPHGEALSGYTVGGGALLASEAIDGIAVAPQARGVGMRLPAQIHIVNHAVVRVFNLVLGLVDLGQLVQVIDGVVVHLILAVFGGHITRRRPDATVRPVSTSTATIRSPPWRILPGAARGAHGHARKQGKLARRARSTYGRRLVGYVAFRARCAPGFGFRV